MLIKWRANYSSQQFCTPISDEREGSRYISRCKWRYCRAHLTRKTLYVVGDGIILALTKLDASNQHLHKNGHKPQQTGTEIKLMLPHRWYPNT